MVGNLLAGTDEAPGEVYLFEDEATKAIVAWEVSAQWPEDRPTAISKAMFKTR